MGGGITDLSEKYAVTQHSNMRIFLMKTKYINEKAA